MRCFARLPTSDRVRRRSVGGDDFQQFVAETVKFAGAHAWDTAQILDGIGAVAGNFGQCGVVEDDIGRHAVAFRRLRAPGAQAFPAARSRGPMPIVGSARSLVRPDDWRVRVGLT